ncbi:hypothetical protein [Streptomyces sp. RKAG293]|uniref:hypothetical protein n=1 Tax=Streptomyces sp. RKAG293 TaxID=2893403 RepID=UPI002033B8A5|nr:hypothetical protein [Streptomyces sp. RKAG293]MCM2416603.1 hypothetical protein [Streptomyces sp. RKAG293]
MAICATPLKNGPDNEAKGIAFVAGYPVLRRTVELLETESMDKIPLHTEYLRVWAALLIDGLSAAIEEFSRPSNTQAIFWRDEIMALITKSLAHLAGTVPLNQWLIHARHRTLVRVSDADRALYLLWIPNLCTAACTLLVKSGGATMYSTSTPRELTQAYYHLERACRALERSQEMAVIAS